MNREFYKGLILADLHFGGHFGQTLYRELQPTITTIRSGQFDFVAILGDYFDTRCSLTSEAARYALKYMSDLTKACSEQGAKLRIIKGTLSHDLNQIETAFSHYLEDSNLNFMIYTSVGEEELFPGFKVLYVPEEYIKSKSDYYGEYFSKEESHYKLALVHGAFENAIPMLKDQEYEGMNPHAPVFTVDDFKCSEAVLCGHIHTRTKVSDNIMYVGSYSRFCYGEEQPKGCLVTVHGDGGFITSFVENTMAPKYITKDFGVSINLLSSKQIIESIKKFKDDNTIDNLRVIIWLEEDDKIIANMAIVKEYFAKEKNIKIVFKNELRTRHETENTKEIEEHRDKYNYLMDRALSVSDKLSIFIKDKKDIEIPSTRIDEILHSDNIIFKNKESDNV
ncbi:MAG: metallophosphoesterase family protein [Fusobacteriaceae bacterium]